MKRAAQAAVKPFLVQRGRSGDGVVSGRHAYQGFEGGVVLCDLVPIHLGELHATDLIGSK